MKVSYYVRKTVLGKICQSLSKYENSCKNMFLLYELNRNKWKYVKMHQIIRLKYFYHILINFTISRLYLIIKVITFFRELLNN
jgi:hypothetical protein